MNPKQAQVLLEAIRRQSAAGQPLSPKLQQLQAQLEQIVPTPSPSTPEG